MNAKNMARSLCVRRKHNIEASSEMRLSQLPTKLNMEYGYTQAAHNTVQHSNFTSFIELFSMQNN